uniref:Uncharacterized protein n=1 Tax=Zea mays TaxID=4577 RepID=C0P540_MAIZE|nr:unknown [Zea mays]
MVVVSWNRTPVSLLATRSLGLIISCCYGSCQALLNSNGF